MVLFVMENALMLTMTQVMRCIRDPSLSLRDKQLLRRELGAELVSLHSLSVSLYLDISPPAINVIVLTRGEDGYLTTVNQSTRIAPCMVQTTLKRSGMDHTAFNLQRTPFLPLPRKRSPDGASTECGGEDLIAASSNVSPVLIHFVQKLV